MNKLIIKYLSKIQEGCCGGGRWSASSGGCGMSYIKRGGTGVCTSSDDVEDLEYQDDYKTQYDPNCMPDTLFTHEDDTDNIDLDDKESSVPSIIDPDDQHSDELEMTQMAAIELPEDGGEAGEKKKIVESHIIQLDEQKIPGELPEEKPPEPVETPTATTELPAGGEAGAEAGMPGEVPMGVEGEEQVPQDPEYIGRVYELKKIYSRLVSIESFLNDASDPKLLKLRKYISSTVELFQTLINNISAYIDNIDDLIILFYKFLLIVYSILRKYYEEEKDDKQDLIRGK